MKGGLKWINKKISLPLGKENGTVGKLLGLTIKNMEAEVRVFF